MKQCNHPECEYPVFSHHFCRAHQYLRTDSDVKIPKTRTMSNTIHTSNSTIKAKFKAPDGQLSMFKEIWAERPHVSELSGDKLMIFDVRNFHHVLTKQAYPKFLLFKPNIILLTRNEHRMIHDYCFEDLVKKDSRWAKVEKQYQLLKEMYNYG